MDICDDDVMKFIIFINGWKSEGNAMKLKIENEANKNR
jgi:hypothetical protein